VYSNFITPPDFVKDKFHTVTVVNASNDEVELLGRMCKGSDDQFNVYLYRSEMNDPVWLRKAAEISDAVIVNTNVADSILEELLTLEKTYYYGGHNFLVKANKVDNVFHYFAIRYHQQNK
jgi:hypothetical protein